MIRRRRARRVTAGLLIALGAALLALAPASPWGAVSFVLGVGLELVGIALERRGPPR